jgi:hypothetical protein
MHRSCEKELTRLQIATAKKEKLCPNGEADCGRNKIQVYGCQLRPGAETANNSSNSRSKTGGFPAIFLSNRGWGGFWGWG